MKRDANAQEVASPRISPLAYARRALGHWSPRYRMMGQVTDLSDYYKKLGTPPDVTHATTIEDKWT